MAGALPFDLNQTNAALEKMGFTYRVPTPVGGNEHAATSQGTDSVYGVAGGILDPTLSAGRRVAALQVPPVVVPTAEQLGAQADQAAALIPAGAAVGPQTRGYAGPSPEYIPTPAPADAQPQAPQAPPPVVRFGAAAQMKATPQEMPTAVASPAMRAPAAPRSPFGAMAADANQRMQTAGAQAQQAEMGGAMGSELQQKGVEQTADAQSATGAAMSRLQSRAADEERDHIARQRVQASAFQEAQDKRVQEMDRDVQAIDQFKVRDDRTATNRATGLIAIALSGIGGAFQAAAGQGGGGNQALQLVQMDLDRRLEMQRAQLADKRTALGAKQSAYGIARQTYGDEQDAMQFARVLELSALEKDLESVKSAGMSQEALGQRDQLLGAIQTQRSDMLLQLHGGREERARGELTQARMAQYQEQKARAAAGSPMAQMAARLKLEGQAASNDKTRAETAKLRGEAGGDQLFLGAGVKVTDPAAWEAYQRTKPAPAEQAKLRSAVQGHASLTAAVKRIAELKKEYGRENFSTEAAAEMDMQQQQAIAGLNEMKDGAMINEGEYERYAKMIPGSSDMAYSALPKLDGILKSVDTRLNAQLKTIGAGINNPAALTRPGAAR